MSETGMAEAPTAKELLPHEAIRQLCLAQHRRFNQENWQGRESYHDDEHVEADILGGRLLVEAAKNGDDPLGIVNDLQEWNRQNSESQVEVDELAEVVEIAFALHDTGNFAEKVERDESGELKVVFLPHYKANGAEERSKQIAEPVVSDSALTEDKKRRYLPLVRHLVNETKFAPGEKVPFGVFARVVDQIGNELFNQNGDMVIGLLEEMRAEDPYAEFAPYFFFNFTRERFRQLVGEEGTREAVLKIWGKTLPEKKEDLEGELVTVSQWLEKRKGMSS